MEFVSRDILQEMLLPKTGLLRTTDSENEFDCGVHV